MKNNQTKSVTNNLDRPFLCLANIYWDTPMILTISNKSKNIYLQIFKLSSEKPSTDLGESKNKILKIFPI